MRLRNDFRVTKDNRTKQALLLKHYPARGDDEAHQRWQEQGDMAQRLYTHSNATTSPWWNGFNDGFPSRKQIRTSPWSPGIRIMESGEIELRDPCGGSSSSLHTREQLRRISDKSLEVTTWGGRPVMYTEDGTKLTKRDYRPLARYCGPHQIDRDRTMHCPTVLLDHELSIAAPLLVGEDGMFAYWPDERSYPMTWSSWLVTIENEEVCKVMAAALRLVCKYANAMNVMMRSAELDTAQKNVAMKEVDRVETEWKTAHKMLQYMIKSRDPKTIAKMIMDEYSSRQVVVLAASLSQQSCGWRTYARQSHITWMGVNGAPYELKFTKTSALFQMLREQTSNQYETKFLYTRPPETRATWRLEQHPFA